MKKLSAATHEEQDYTDLNTSVSKKSQTTLEQLGTGNTEVLTRHITIASSMISGKAPSPFCSTYAEDLLESFPDMEISEIIAAIKRGEKGEFGPVYLLNGTVLYDWVKRHKRFRYNHERLKEHETYMDRIIRNRIDPRDTAAVARFLEEEDKHPSTVKIIQDKFRNHPELFPYVKD